MEQEQDIRAAGLPRHLAAICYDLLLVLALLMTFAFIVIALRRGSAVDAGAAWFQLLLLVIWWLYFSWSWTHGGQTIGMRAWRLELLAADGGPVSWRAATIRFAGAGLSALAAGLGYIWSLFDRAGRTWHDRLSRTQLVCRPRASAGAPAPER